MVGPTNQCKKVTKNWVRFTLSTSLFERLNRIERYSQSRRVQTGSGIANNLANLALKMGSRASNSVLGKKLIDKGIENVPNIFKYGASKIKNKNVQFALNSDTANYVAEEAENKVKNKARTLFD